MPSLHAAQARLLAWLDQHYLHAPHAGLLGRSRQEVLDDDLVDDERPAMSEELLREALSIRQNRRVRTDGTLEVAGRNFELEQGFLAGHKWWWPARWSIRPSRHGSSTTSSVSLCGPSMPPRTPSGNEPRRPKRGLDAIPFDPPGTLLKAMLLPKKGDGR